MTSKDEIIGKVIVVWFSCGAASAVAAKMTIDTYGANNAVRIVNNKIADEDPDNWRFLTDVEVWLGRPVEFASNPKYPNCSCEEVWEDRQFMSSPYGAPCTLELKKKARYEFERNNHIDWHVMGFCADEPWRFEAFIKSERPNVLPVLIDEGMTKQDCFDLLLKEGVRPPAMYEYGYANANCPGCVKATSPTYWNLVRKTHPEVFKRRAEQSRLIGAKLVRYKNKRIFLDELPPDAKGHSLKSLHMECGIFCEIHPNILKYYKDKTPPTHDQ